MIKALGIEIELREGELGVVQMLAWLGSASRSRRAVAAARWPPQTAQYRGVQPVESFTLTFAP